MDDDTKFLLKVILMIAIIVVILLILWYLLRPKDEKKAKCKSDADCVGSDAPICHNGNCIQCAFDSDCCGSDVCNCGKCQSRSDDIEFPSQCDFVEPSIENFVNITVSIDNLESCDMASCNCPIPVETGNPAGIELFRSTWDATDVTDQTIYILTLFHNGPGEGNPGWIITEPERLLNGGFGAGLDENLPMYVCNAGGDPFRGTNSMLIVPFAIEANVTSCTLTMEACGAGEGCMAPTWDMSWNSVPNATGYYICASADFDIDTNDSAKRVKWYSFVGFVPSNMTSAGVTTVDDSTTGFFGVDGTYVEGTERCRVFAVNSGCTGDPVEITGLPTSTPNLDE